jgi:hypothetical protein
MRARLELKVGPRKQRNDDVIAGSFGARKLLRITPHGRIEGALAA